MKKSRSNNRPCMILTAIFAALIPFGCSPPVQTAEHKWSRSGTSATAIDHRLWDELLSVYVKSSTDRVNRVDYAALKENDVAKLERYLGAMQAVDIERHSRDEQFAFWVNLYNAATVDVIVDQYPLNSIKDIGAFGRGPWKKKILTVSGTRLSLDDIEHGILRPIWKDVRIHYAVNCAAIGCPNLADRAYSAPMLETMLDEAAAAYVNHPRGFRRRNGKLSASSIYDWYGSDWGNQRAVLDHAREYASVPTMKVLGTATTIYRFEYDWSLNEQ